MNPLDWLGPGLCHQITWRMMESAWLCDRCSGLYFGGFVGVAMAGVVARRIGLKYQIGLLLLLLLPMAIDKLFFGLGSTIDVRAWRIFTGLAAGAGTGLFLGARAVGYVRWPATLSFLHERGAVVAWSLLVIAALTAYAGSFFLFNSLVIVGLVMLCVAGTAWALSLFGAIWRRLKSRQKKEEAASALALWMLLLIVVAELVVVAVIPGEYKPHMGWFWAVISVFGIGRWL